MTYANDMIGMRKVLISRQTDVQLDRAVKAAVARFGEDFWTLLYGVDAYQERRRRRLDRHRNRRSWATDALARAIQDQEDDDHTWGKD